MSNHLESRGCFDQQNPAGAKRYIQHQDWTLIRPRIHERLAAIGKDPLWGVASLLAQHALTPERQRS